MSSSEYPRDSPRPLQTVAVGNIVGTPLVGAMEWFLKRHGKAAGHELVNRLPPRWSGMLSPHAPNLGLLGAKKYPQNFMGDVLRGMVQAAHITDEDLFIRDVATAGIDASVGTVARILLRLAATPQSLAARGQEAWSLFYDSGRVRVEATDHEYLSTTTEWANHDAMVCRVSMEVRRRLIERTGVTILEVRRDRCVGWGHDACVVRIRW